MSDAEKFRVWGWGIVAAVASFDWTYSRPAPSNLPRRRRHHRRRLQSRNREGQRDSLAV
jgi:hypothetical protein